MNKGYTKGKWEVISAEFTDKGVAFEVIMPKQEICIGNARLIAAAPDMYEACKEARLAMWNKYGTINGTVLMSQDKYMDDAYDKICEAIALVESQ